jgi:hypothetical protein
VNGDAVPDTVLITGPGTAVRFAVVSGANGALLVPPTAPFAGSEAFAGGGFVAAGDLDGDGRAEMAFSPDQAGGARVTVFSLLPGGLTVRLNFLTFTDDPNFRGGARVAIGDVDRDAVPDLAVAAGISGGPRVTIVSGRALVRDGDPVKIADFFVFPDDAATLRNGAFIALGDVNGDGFADVIAGGGPGGGPRVLILNGQLVAAGRFADAQAAPVGNFFVEGNTADRGGVRVAAKDADGDDQADVVTGSGANLPARVHVYLGRNPLGEPAAQVIDPFGGAVLADGVYVG